MQRKGRPVGPWQMVMIFTLLATFFSSLCAAQVGGSSAGGEEEPLKAMVKDHIWEGLSNCKHKTTGKRQPVTAKFSGFSEPIITIKISTNIEGISGFTVDTRTVYYTLNITLQLNKRLYPKLASDKTDIHVDEAPNYDYGTAPYLNQIDIEFFDVEFLVVNLPVLCGSVRLKSQLVTPAPTKARNSTDEGGAFNFIKAHIKSLTIYLPIIIAFSLNVIALLWCYCARKSLFGDDEAIDEKLGIVRPGKEKSARLNRDGSPSPDPAQHDLEEEDVAGIPLPTTKPGTSSSTDASSKKAAEQDDLESFL